jgi:hypothetical protein
VVAGGQRVPGCVGLNVFGSARVAARLFKASHACDADFHRKVESIAKRAVRQQTMECFGSRRHHPGADHGADSYDVTDDSRGNAI